MLSPFPQAGPFTPQNRVHSLSELMFFPPTNPFLKRPGREEDGLLVELTLWVPPANVRECATRKISRGSSSRRRRQMLPLSISSLSFSIL